MNIAINFLFVPISAYNIFIPCLIVTQVSFRDCCFAVLDTIIVSLLTCSDQQLLIKISLLSHSKRKMRKMWVYRCCWIASSIIPFHWLCWLGLTELETSKTWKAAYSLLCSQWIVPTPNLVFDEISSLPQIASSKIPWSIKSIFHIISFACGD